MGYCAEIFPCEGNETLAQVLQKRHSYPIPRGVPGQAGRGLEQPGLVGVAAHARGFEDPFQLKLIQNSMIQ